MKYIEILLKLAFLVLAVIVLVTKAVPSVSFDILLVVCIFLGLVLLFNKQSSYGFPQAKKDFVMRRIEGVLLMAFSIISYIDVMYWMN